MQRELTRRVYLDALATTPLDPRILQAMMPYFAGEYGNASSRHHDFGNQARIAVEQARYRLKQWLGGESRGLLLFTSGATESNNLVFRGLEDAAPGRRHLIVSAIEHSSVLAAASVMERKGFEVTRVPVDGHGMIQLDRLAEALRPATLLVSVMGANNEVGSMQPLARVGEMAREAGAFFHCDASQLLGKGDFHAERMGADFVSFSGHKLCGPKGVGGLLLSGRAVELGLSTQLSGGGQQWGLRAGTYDVPSIVGLAEAARLYAAEGAAEAVRLRELRDGLERTLVQRFAPLTVYGDRNVRLPGALLVTLPGVRSAQLLDAIPDVALSPGAACSTGNEGSHVLRAMGVGRHGIAGALRFGLHRFTTADDIAYAVERLAWALERLRKTDVNPVRGVRRVG